MLRAKDVAVYFLKLDTDGRLFNSGNRIEMNGRRFYEGNARLNKYLHLAQNLYYAKTGTLLFSDNLYAYDNGGVVKNVQENYFQLLKQKNQWNVSIPDDIKVFLGKLFGLLQNAEIDDLIQISHEDPAWKERHTYTRLNDQIMDTRSMLDDYRERYEDALELMERMPVQTV